MPALPHTRALALRLMDELGRELLGETLAARGWTFGFDRARKRLGVCRIRDKRITLSAHLAQLLPAADVEDTVRHEIAHAIDAERRGRSPHDRTWNALAVACGAAPARCFDGDLPDDPRAPYVATCPSCGASHNMYRQPATPRRCSPCARAGHPAFLRIVHAPTGHVIWPGGAERGAYGGTAGVEATCPSCGKVYRRARRPRRDSACASCCGRHASGHYDARFRLQYR